MNEESVQQRSNLGDRAKNLLLSPCRLAHLGALSNAIALIAILGSAAFPGYPVPSSNRVLVNLDTTWKFHKGDVTGAQATTYNDSSWTSLNLPHTWNAIDGYDGNSDYYRGIGWYRRHFTASSSYAGRSLYIRFDGANIATTVYLNGTLLGQHKGGFAAFDFDATSAIKVGADNVLAVEVNNAEDSSVPPLNADFTFFGGIYRDVNLLVTDKLSITPLDYASPGVYLEPTKVGAASANLQVTIKLKNDNTVSKAVTISTVISDSTGAVVATLPGTTTLAAGGTGSIVQNTVVANPHLWNAKADPYLYQATVLVYDGTTLTDVIQQNFGFRFYSVDPNQGFFLNGSYLDLHGTNRHQDRKDTGWAITQADHLQDFNFAMELGCTALRLSHYQHASYFYDLCDKNGMVVWAEIPYIDAVNNSTAFFDDAESQLTELIRQNYNRPSIFFWSVGNEVASTTASNTLLQDMNDLAHQEDPNRLTTYASDAKDSTSPVNFHTDVQGYNRYYGWYSAPPTTFADFAKSADGFHKTYPTRSVAISEFGAGAAISQHSLSTTPPAPYGTPHPEEYQSLFHEAYWPAMKARKYLWGKFIWTLFDFASDTRIEGDTHGENDKGLVTYDRKTRKDAFFYYKANWTTAPLVYIASRRYTPRAVDTVPVKVYANVDSVQVYVDDVYKSTVVSDGSCVFRWAQVKLQKGPNIIKAVGFKGGVQYLDSCEWTFGTADAIATKSGTVEGREVRLGDDRMLTVINPNAIADLNIANLKGTRVYHQDNIAVGTERVSLRTLPPGVYVVTLSGFQSSMVRKIVVP
jgi:beta-galactosidase